MEEKKVLQPHEQRVVDERNNLSEITLKLGDFIDSSPIYKKLEIEDQELLVIQKHHMNNYLHTLNRRINRFTKD